MTSLHYWQREKHWRACRALKTSILEMHTER